MVENTSNIIEENENHDYEHYESNRRMDTSLVSNQTEQLLPMNTVPT